MRRVWGFKKGGKRINNNPPPSSSQFYATKLTTP